MPRTKGSKDCPKTNITKDYASKIAKKQERITTLTIEIASIQKVIEEQKNTLKEKKTEAESVLKKLLASGMSEDEILEKLK
ncbi:hypothetical protein [Gallintestinimicrobium sp.]|jgi:hypothetical protein|uniref:hypothetical protein n=1 Tax=Gallintestinimicrobium sp. TaxID=2981655 RepID=UPI003999B812